MKAGLKEKLLLLSINQEKGNLRNQENFHKLVFGASLLDLACLQLVAINQGVWHISDKQPGDPVLDEVLRIVKPRDGKKPQWFAPNLSIKASKLLSMQVDWMMENRWIESKKITLFGASFFSKFRINKPEMLRPEMLDIERVLIYGRKPSLKIWMLIMLLGAAGNLKKLFRSSESRSRAQERYKELRKMPPADATEVHLELIKKLRESLGGLSGLNNVSAFPSETTE